MPVILDSEDNGTQNDESNPCCLRCDKARKHSPKVHVSRLCAARISEQVPKPTFCHTPQPTRYLFLLCSGKNRHLWIDTVKNGPFKLLRHRFARARYARSLTCSRSLFKSRKDLPQRCGREKVNRFPVKHGSVNRSLRSFCLFLS